MCEFLSVQGLIYCQFFAIFLPKGGCTSEVKLLAFFPKETGSGKHDIDKLELLGKAEVNKNHKHFSVAIL